MFKRILPLALAASALFVITSCENNSVDVNPEEDPNAEFRHIRILVSDEVTNDISLVNPFSKEVLSFQAQYPKSALYTTESSRFAGIVHRDNDMMQTFDIGLENHGDHVDVKGTPKFGALEGQSSKPTHFKSKRGEILTFNDGDGTLSIGKESEIHVPDIKMQVINANLKAHHGAMAHFMNGTYAVTEKDNSIPGTLPERVKIIDSSGKTIHESKLATEGIHGNATDGNSAVFGSASGILVVEENGNQKFIPHPSDFGTTWFGTIMETSKQGNFLGYTASKGVYLINTTTNEIKPIHESNDIMQAKVSMDYSRIAILSHSGDMVYKDIFTGGIIKSNPALLAATAKDETQKPQMVVSGKFAYITQPKIGEVLMVNIKNPSIQQRIKVSNRPYSITVLGYESNEIH
ncbi:hypothetical protein SAMN06298216_3475 [Spirosomataceae bacterium TFI 002]|nr:hypothetical protein SAMN06298216_3475 [Spirosomataceae bacterium TFI 002]